DGSYDKVLDVGTTDSSGYTGKYWTPPDDPKYTGTKNYILYFAGYDNYNQSQTAQYSLTLTCNPACESRKVGKDVGYKYLYCSTCDSVCGWTAYGELPPGYGTAACTIGGDCYFSPSSFIVQNKGESCSGSGTICQTGSCPNYSGWNGEDCSVAFMYWCIMNSSYIRLNSGKWDASDPEEGTKCVQCDANHKEIAVCGDTSGIYAGGTSGCAATMADNKCESACNASSECDELSPGDSCGAGKICSDSCICEVAKPDLVISSGWDAAGTIKY
ncbi:unnamed protein product, partial [marine sediment metagenome]